MKNRFIKLIALIVAVLMTASLFASCGKDTAATKKKKKVIKKVIVAQSADEDDFEDEDEDFDDEEIDENDDVTLSYEYSDDTTYSLKELLASDSPLETLYSHNGTEPLCTTFRGLTGTVYHATEFLPDADPNKRKYTDEMLNLELTRYTNAGYKYVRTWLRSEWAYTGDDSDPWNWETPRMLGFYEYCKTVASYGLEVNVNFGWAYDQFFYGPNTYLQEVDYMYPRVYNADGTVKIEEDFGTYHVVTDTEEQARRYAQWGVEFIQALAAHGVTNANRLLLFTEPHEDGGSPTGAFAKYMLITYSALHNALKDAGLRDKVTIIGPNQSSKQGGLMKYFMSYGPDIFDIYTSHFWTTGTSPTDDTYEINKEVFQRYMSWFKDFEITKECWVDESNWGCKYGGGYDDAWSATQCGTIFAAFMNSGISAVQTWQTMDQTWVDYYGSGGQYEYGTQITGFIPSLYNTETPYLTYYASSLISKYFSGKNGKTFDSLAENDASGLYIGTAQLEDGNWTVLVVNMTTDTKNIDVTFDKAINTTMYRYLYSPKTVKPTSEAKIITADKCLKNVGRHIVDSLEGGSVVIYSTIKNVG